MEGVKLKKKGQRKTSQDQCMSWLRFDNERTVAYNAPI